MSQTVGPGEEAMPEAAGPAAGAMPEAVGPAEGAMLEAVGPTEGAMPEAVGPEQGGMTQQDGSEQETVAEAVGPVCDAVPEAVGPRKDSVVDTDRPEQETTPRRVRPRQDATLQVKRAVMRTLFRGADHTLVERLAAQYISPDHPGLALNQGELLVRSPRRVLALTAHPDDLEFFCGGTLRRMAQAGSRITAVVLSDGEKRGNWRDLAQQRQSEQRIAAALQGYESVTFLGLPDFGLPEDPRLEQVVARAWDEVAPEVLFAFDPKELVPQMANRDHKALGRTVMDVARARFATGVQVFFYGSHHPDTLVDITGVMPEKIRAAKAHRSQMVYLDEQETDGAFHLMGRIMAGNSGVRYAEALFRLM